MDWWGGKRFVHPRKPDLLFVITGRLTLGFFTHSRCKTDPKRSKDYSDHLGHNPPPSYLGFIICWTEFKWDTTFHLLCRFGNKWVKRADFEKVVVIVHLIKITGKCPTSGDTNWIESCPISRPLPLLSFPHFYIRLEFYSGFCFTFYFYLVLRHLRIIPACGFVSIH